MTPKPVGGLPALDPLLHQPVRTQLTAYLSGRGTATFPELKRVLGITDGNLGAHLSKLVDAGYVATEIEASESRSRTVYALTTVGRGALAEYAQRLSALVELSRGPRRADGGVGASALSEFPSRSPRWRAKPR